MQPLPAGVACAADYQAHARAALPDPAWDYFAAHAGDGITARANGAAWDGIALLPRVLRGVRDVATSTDLFGQALPWPLLAAPMALQRLAHPDGEVALALAASAQGAGLVLGSQASMPIEAVAAAFGAAGQRGPFWFQLYWLPDRGATLALLHRAEAAGCQAIVLTVDAGVRAG
ncbi:MAG TPA: alpha-hydroxy-acid oxidizing protein, partial [Ramlibacter sp.]|nr:alpha-hydroxy-acid oxidizing protein [Ramlibacter sp.]